MEMVVLAVTEALAVKEVEEMDITGTALIGLLLTLLVNQEVRLVLAVKEETVEEAAQEAVAVTEELVVDLKAAVLMELLVEMVVMEQGHNMAVEGIQAAKMVRRELVAVLVLVVLVERITAVVVT